MITVNIRETDEFIKLGQALKKAGLVESGVDAKFFIQDGQVKLNGETELQRGKKLYNGDVVSFNGESKDDLLRLAACMEEHFQIVK